MDIKVIILFVAFSNILLGWLVYSQGKKKTSNITFSLVAFFAGLWSASLYFYEHPIISSSLGWIRITYLLSFITLFFFFCFSIVFKGKRIKNTLFSLFLYLIGSSIFIYFLFFTDLFIKNVFFVGRELHTTTGPLYLLFIIYVSVFVFWSLYNLVTYYFVASGIERMRLRYLLFGGLIGGIGAIIVDGFIPLFTGSSRYFWLSPIATIFLIISTAYAITRYRLMDVSLVIGRGIVYIFSFVLVIVLALLLLFANNHLAQPVSINIATPLILVICVLFFQPIFNFFEKLASKYFYYTFYSYQTVLTDLGRRLTKFLDLDILSSTIAKTLIDTMKLDRTVILLRESGNGEFHIQKNIGFREENGISLVKDNFLTIWMEKTQKPLVYEELSLIIRDSTDEKEKERLETLRENMRRIEAALCLPLLSENKIIGMIVLGNKISGSPYSQQDIELLINLSNQASIALQNAKLYSEVKGFSAKLEKEVDKATKELKEAYEDLQKLDKAKSEFISIASHQLRTPLTAIKGYASMIREGSYGKLPNKVDRPLENIFKSTERLIRLVNDLLNVSRIEAGRLEMNYEKVAIDEIVKSVFEEIKNEAAKKGLYLKWEPLEKTLPLILVDKDKFRQVILNLVDNAIRYTEKGGITIKCDIQNEKFKIEISDTGEGMTEEEIGKMFTSFSRGSAGTQFYTEGAGLGLYVAKKFIEMHNGKIWAESKGKEKGSTFHIELPIKQTLNI